MSIGERLAKLREYRNLTQEELAERAGVHVDTIRKLEQGVRENARMTTYGKLAAALDIELGRLLGQATMTQQLPESGGLIALRNAVQDMTGLPGVPTDAHEEDAPTIADLRDAFTRAQATYRKGRFTELTRTLPGLVTDLRAAARETTGGRDSDTVWSMNAATYIIAADLSAQLGQTDLAYTAVERALHASQRASDPLREALAVSTLSLVLLRQGRWDQAHDIAVRKAAEIEPRFSSTDREQLAMYGVLLLSGAVPASRGRQATAARELVKQATAAATLSGTLHVRGTAFGPSSVAMQATTVAISLGDAEEALNKARGVDLQALPWPISRARHRLDVAHARYQLRDHEAALTTLLEIETEQPEWMKHQVLAASTVRELLDEERRKNAPLRGLASRLGVDPTL
ncbi:helix-turn-helix transcriptional regulator [Streptomyces sp. NPDC020096]